MRTQAAASNRAVSVLLEVLATATPKHLEEIKSSVALQILWVLWLL
jgi:hypothetical protein